jgi:hypothetical protein
MQELWHCKVLRVLCTRMVWDPTLLVLLVWSWSHFNVSRTVSFLDSSGPLLPILVSPPGIDTSDALSLLLGYRRLRPYFPLVYSFLNRFPIRLFIQVQCTRS